MKNVNSKVTISVLVLLVVLAFSSVFAATTTTRIVMGISATYDGHVISDDTTRPHYEAKPGQKITISADPTKMDESLMLYVDWAGTLHKVATGSKTGSFTVPSMNAGDSVKVQVQATIDNDAEKYVGRSNNVVFYLDMPGQETDTTVDVNVLDGNKTLAVGSTTTKAVGSVLRISANTNKVFDRVRYTWDNEPAKSSTESNFDITVPNYAAGTKHTLLVQAAATNGKKSEAKEYTIVIPNGSKVDGNVDVRYNGNLLTDGQYPISVNSNTIEVELSGNPASAFQSIVYTVNNGRSEEIANPKGQKVKIELEPGQTKTLQVYGLFNDNTQTKVSKYNFVYEYVPENDDLIIEDWMKENKEAEGLLVSLRNDSDEYEKKNKNMYALGEEVVYYVDYKNAGKDINQEVRLVLELPLEFDVVNSYGGTVDKEKKTITWTMKDGLEKGEAGTKIVKIEYTSLGKSSRKSDTVYPSAKIYQGTSKSPKDISTVINFIFKDEDTEIQDDHYPYMYGDADKNTFRPDDTIKRAEGALVLARIFGINYSGTQVIGNEYSDLDETYLEAQKAIVASKKLGIINGYPDGSFRPNAKMTKAEFIKIIAAYVEKKAEEDEIKGLEIKDEENAIKLYKNATNVYVTGNSTQDAHWAISYVTLLTRINMTPVNGSRKTIALDDEITRAEVAQLVNFYLFRAPAEGGKTNFSDVSKSHKLFADIVEATRPVHSYTLTSEGTEVAVKD